MSNVINSIVTDAINDRIESVNIPSFARPQVDAAIAAIAADLAGRAETIAEIIRARAAEAGISESDVENVLIETGLADVPQEDEEEEALAASDNADIAALTAIVSRLATTVEKIVDAAEANGIRI